jgi:uncharacterized membrane protein
MTESLPPPDDVSVASARPDGVRTLVVADFSATSAALSAYERLTTAAEGGQIDIEGAVVVSKAVDGTLTFHETTDRSTRRGMTWGAVGGAVVGVLFPPTILGSAMVAGIIGAGVGKGVKAARTRQVADDVHHAIDPGHTGVVALVSDPYGPELTAALAGANRVLTRAVEDADMSSITAAAAQAQSEARPG